MSGRRCNGRSLNSVSCLDDLTLERLAPFDELTISAVAVELGRQPFAGSEVRRCLQVIVEVRLGTAAAVAALTQLLTCLYILTFTDQYTSLLHMSQERVLAVAVIDDHVVDRKSVV